MNFVCYIVYIELFVIVSTGVMDVRPASAAGAAKLVSAAMVSAVQHAKRMYIFQGISLSCFLILF